MIATSLLAQEDARTTLQQRASDLGRRSAAKYIFAPGTDALLMTVKVWGEVRQPGIYEVPIGLDLIELISSAGGPTSKAKLSKVKIIRTDVESEEERVMSANVREFLNTGDVNLVPIIKPGDTVVVPIKPTQYILTTFSWTQQLLSLFSIYTMILYYSQK